MCPASSKNFTSSLFEGTLRSSDRLVGSPSRQSVELFQEAHGGFAIWLDPFGMLDPQIIVNLLLEFGVGVDFVIHGNWIGERFKCGAARFPQRAWRNHRRAFAPSAHGTAK